MEKGKYSKYHTTHMSKAAKKGQPNPLPKDANTVKPEVTMKQTVNRTYADGKLKG